MQDGARDTRRAEIEEAGMGRIGEAERTQAAEAKA